MCATKATCISLASLILSFYTSESLSKILLPNDGIDEKSIQCMEQIVSANIPCGRITASVIGNEADISYFIRRVKSGKQSEICFTSLIRTYSRFNTRVKSDAYIIIIDNFHEFEQGIYNISTGTFWNPANKILIYLPHWMTTTTLSHMFNIALKFRMFNMVLVGNVDDDFGIYTYYPFANQNCGNKFDSIEKISDCSSSTNFTDVFPKIDESYFKNCTIRIAVIEDIPNVIIQPETMKQVAFSGIEQLTIEIAAKMQGMRVEYIVGPTTYGFVLSNRSVTGLLGLIQDGKADFAAGGMVLSFNRAEVFNYLLGPKLSKYVMYTHTFAIPKWKNLYREFAGTLWIFTVVVSVLLITIMVVFKHFSSGKKQIDLISYAVKLYGYFFSNPSSVLNKDRSLRIFFGFWIVFAMYMSNFYLSKLFSIVLMENERVKEDVSVFELLANPNRIPCISNITEDFFANVFGNYATSDNRTRIPECESTSTVFNAVADNENYYTFELDHVYEMRECSLLDENGKSKVTSWSANSFNVYLSIYFYKGFPLKKRFQYTSQRIFEVGLIAKQGSDIVNEKNIGCGKRSRTFHIYTLGDMRLAFYVLFIGIFISFITFLCEIQLARKS